MFEFFSCTPFLLRILTWSFVVPWSHFHLPNAFKSYRFNRGWYLTVPHLPHEMDLEMWSAVDRDGCFLLRYPNLWRLITFYDLTQPWFNSTKWCSIAKLVNITPATRTYGRDIYSWWGYKPTNISGGHHIVGMSQLMQVYNPDSTII